MDNIDLLALVRRFGKLDNVELYGYISSRLPRPVNLFDSCMTQKDGFFVKMDVLAVNLQKYSRYLKDLGIVNKENDDIYLVNGSVALYVDSRGVFPDWYATRGTLRLGSKTDNSYLTLFPFRKHGNDWSIVFNDLYTMDISNWGRHSRLYLSVNKSLENGFVTVPDDVARLQHFDAKQVTGVTVPVVNNNEKVSLNSSLQSSLNGVTPVEVLKSVDNFKIVDRDAILPEPDELSKLRDKLNSLKVLSSNFVESLKYDYSVEDEVNDKVAFMISSLRVNLKSRPSDFASTGRVLLKKYLNKFGDYATAEYLGSTAGKYLIDNFYEVADLMLGNVNSINADGKAWNLCKKAFLDSELFYARMLGIILGVDTEKLEEICYLCKDNDISFVKLISLNPYLLLLLSSDFSYQEVDYIAYCLGKLNDKSIEEYKLVCILFNYLNNSDIGSTTYRYSNILSSKIGTTLSKAKYNQCRQSGSYLSDVVKSNIYFYIDNTLSNESYKYPSSGWIQSGYSYILPLSKKEIELGLDKAIKHGVAIKYDVDGESWVSSVKLMDKELSICDKMYELSQGNKGYDHDLIDAYIDEYERMVGFKLEVKQRKAVHLVDNYVAVVTGPAGSGKTTVSDCMVFVLDKLGESNVEYAAPTGKAAKRLQEVVKKPVQTFNSKFKIFGGSSSLFDADDVNIVKSDVVYFFDEVGMGNINLIHAVCQNLYDCSAYLLGDICQLPPIGKGLPFKNLLRFLPCVRLDVTKRSAENSGITYNSRVINEFSETSNWQSLKEFDDFKILQCNEDDIKRITVLLCKYHLNKATDKDIKDLCSLIGKKENELIKIPDLSPDDIQVVSPIGKQTYTWGTYQLNIELQSIFNETSGYNKSFKYQVSNNYAGTKFLLNDRVIHTDSNMYSMQWYSSYENGSFQKTYGFGIANGDVGKIVAFYPSQSCEFLEEDGCEPDDFKYPENLRDDSTFVSSNNWFIVVEYYDFMSDSNFYILYRATENFNVDCNECKVFGGDDLKKLNLFYAGTTHKMQGSQAKLIIGLLGRVNFKGFLSRNMLYTEITRASEGVYLIGSVGNNRNSQLSVARSTVADEGVDTVQGLIFH